MLTKSGDGHLNYRSSDLPGASRAKRAVYFSAYMQPILEYVFAWEVLSLGVSLLIGATLVLVSDEFQKFQVARALFYLAAAWMVGKVLMWSYFSSERFFTRAVITFLVWGLVGVGTTEAVRLIKHRENETSTVEQDEKKQPSQQTPTVQQHSEGPNSPNTTVIGSNDTVNIGDPKTNARLDEIKKLLKDQDDPTREKNLLKKYPFGYVIFDVDYTNSVVPYESRRIFENWNIDWTTAKLERAGVNGDAIKLTLPHIWRKNGSINFKGMDILAPRKVGMIANVRLSNEMIAEGKILAVRDDGIVWVVGFGPIPKDDDLTPRSHLPD